MGALKIVVMVLLILVSVAMIVVVMLQEGKSAGLSGAISGAAETFWSRNKGRSREGKLAKYTKILLGAFVVLALLLNIIS